MSKKVLVTAALPYANGPIHLGHMVEHVQADIYVRFLRSAGRDAVFLCADDTHGTPIEVNARKQGIAPEQLIERYGAEHQRDFGGFGIQYGYYGSTNFPENKRYAELFFERLKARGDIEKRPVEQYYCEKDARFLPDRFIKGTCPNCKSADQYGDVCEKCGKTHAPTDLIEPRCALCGTPPVRRTSDHYFVRLSRFDAFLREFTSREGRLDPAVRNGLQRWFEEGLQDWDISRDGPYFGFKIPGEQDKYFYVWLDAPIGYVSTTERFCGDAMKYWAPSADTEIVHVIGKDIVYFHTLFWPAMLHAAGFKLPERIIVHGMLTLNGEKMSKSRGTFITARQYLDTLDPAYLRYFFASNLGPGPEDFDLSLEEFRNRVNAELVNNIGNLCNRSLSMIATELGGELNDTRLFPGHDYLPTARADIRTNVANAFRQLRFREAVRKIVEVSTEANRLLTEAAPWKGVKGDAKQRIAAHQALSAAAEVAYLLAVGLSPVVPTVAEKLFAQLGVKPLTFEQLERRDIDANLLPPSHRIGKPEPLVPRLEAKQVEALIAPAEEPKLPAKPAVEAPVAGTIQYDDFAKLDLRVGQVLAAEKVPKADKLLKLTVDLGEAQPRTVAAGIAEHYAPEQMVGRRVVVVANLAPKKVREVVSHGMLLAGSDEAGKTLRVVDGPADLPPGSKVK